MHAKKKRSRKTVRVDERRVDILFSTVGSLFIVITAIKYKKEKKKRNKHVRDGLLAKSSERSLRLFLFGEMTESIKKPHCLG